MALQVHHEDLAVETRYPDVFPRHGGAPSDSVDPRTHEAGDRGRECGTVRAELRDASADVLHSVGLRARHPIHTAPEIAVGVEHQPARRVDATARKAQDEREVIRRVQQVRHKRRRVRQTLLRLRIGLLEECEEVLGMCPRLTRNAGHRCKRVRRRRSSAWRCRVEEPRAPVIAGRRAGIGDEGREGIEVRKRRAARSRGHIPRTSSHSSRRHIRRRRRVCRTRRRLCLTCCTRRRTSRSSCAFRAVASTHRAG